MLLCSALIVPGSSAQSLPLPATELSPTGGVDLSTGPEGVKLGLAGDTGGVNLEAGPGGASAGLRTTPKAAGDPGERVSVPTRPPGDGPGREGSPGESAPAESAPGSGPGGTIAVTGAEPGSDRAGRGARGRGEDRSGETSRSADLRPAARADREGRGAVAPVFDLVERIPAVVRAGLVALALIAVALWALWVRGRRRLEHNAYMDPDTDVANMAAFEQLLEREWQRASRYRRPLGLLLLESEQGKDVVQDVNRHVRGADIVARVAPSRIAVICPEAPHGSVETLAHAIEHGLEDRRVRCWAGFAERDERDERPADLVARAAASLADAQNAPLGADVPDAPDEHETLAFPARSRVAA